MPTMTEQTQKTLTRMSKTAQKLLAIAIKYELISISLMSSTHSDNSENVKLIAKAIDRSEIYHIRFIRHINKMNMILDAVTHHDQSRN